MHSSIFWLMWLCLGLFNLHPLDLIRVHSFEAKQHRLSLATGAKTATFPILHQMTSNFNQPSTRAHLHCSQSLSFLSQKTRASEACKQGNYAIFIFYSSSKVFVKNVGQWPNKIYLNDFLMFHASLEILQAYILMNLVRTL